MAVRYICCKDCHEDIPHSQQQWRSKVKEFGSPQSFKKNYQCRKCRVMEKNDPMKYHLLYGKMLKTFRRDVRSSYKVYYNSNRTRDDLMKLQSDIDRLFIELPIYKYCKLDKVLHTSQGRGFLKLDGITIQNFPMVGDHYITLSRKRRKTH